MESRMSYLKQDIVLIVVILAPVFCCIEVAQLFLYSLKYWRWLKSRCGKLPTSFRWLLNGSKLFCVAFGRNIAWVEPLLSKTVLECVIYLVLWSLQPIYWSGYAWYLVNRINLIFDADGSVKWRCCTKGCCEPKRRAKSSWMECHWLSMYNIHHHPTWSVWGMVYNRQGQPDLHEPRKIQTNA